MQVRMTRYGSASAADAATCLAAEAGVKCPRLCSIAAERKTSITPASRAGRRAATASRRACSEGQPPQNQTEWNGLVTWPVACACAYAYFCNGAT